MGFFWGGGVMLPLLTLFIPSATKTILAHVASLKLDCQSSNLSLPVAAKHWEFTMARHVKRMLDFKGLI